MTWKVGVIACWSPYSGISKPRVRGRGLTRGCKGEGLVWIGPSMRIWRPKVWRCARSV